ncbi:23S rRNA (guanosine(2251)-2'-O)-methyltransferase RlmB [Thermotalea metallivorans]|uniref:Putative TrmH family tRNA/rRNA methyltransferase n=1 Tax=Thermotalea metallivorans TaxID=520762 RepID=A0A140L2M8_9FIRM|nr:23S rRNA (guanosine(2251)-2'-O)-methyltransferase RlmB [Thermotalea metallivorans]KXG74803.1 putative TrmH family tRNA/rRNA methyltransferase [Thermotalea metallivorans]
MSRSDKIEGRNPVMEALKAEREIDKILVAKGAAEGSIHKIVGIAKERGIPIQYVERQKLDQLSESHAHQGIIAFAAAHAYVDVAHILKKAEEKGEDPFIVILDEITDPHNLGSVIRTAYAAGVHGVIIPKRRAVGLTAVVAKTSAGAIEYVPVAKVSNLAQTIDRLKERGLWIIGADMDGEKAYYENDLTGKIALVIGSEGKGIGRLIKEKCDFIIHIPMKGEVGSLNASVAAAILMYEVMKQRKGKE